MQSTIDPATAMQRGGVTAAGARIALSARPPATSRTGGRVYLRSDQSAPDTAPLESPSARIQVVALKFFRTGALPVALVLAPLSAWAQTNLAPDRGATIATIILGHPPITCCDLDCARFPVLFYRVRLP